MKNLALCLTVLFALISVPSYAQDQRFDQGSWEIGIESSASDLSLEPFVGYFIADNLEAVVHFDYSTTTTDFPTGFQDLDSTALVVTADLLFNIPTGTSIVPVIGGGLVYFSQTRDYDASTVNDSDDTGLGLRGVAGLRFLVGDRAAVNINAEAFLLQVDDNTNDLSADVTGVGIGVSYSLFF
jgi:hypothetical protein